MEKEQIRKTEGLIIQLLQSASNPAAARKILFRLLPPVKGFPEILQIFFVPLMLRAFIGIALVECPANERKSLSQWDEWVVTEVGEEASALPA